MKTIYRILQEFNESNSRNYKLELLEKYKDNKLFIEIYKLTYDRVMYNFGITLKNIKRGNSGDNDLNLEDLKLFYTRELTGNKALFKLQEIYDNLNKESQYILERILDRDLKIGINSKSFNKVIKDGIFTLPYMRCSLDTKHITFPAILQLKADGTYRTFIKSNGRVTCFSRSGEEYEYPKLFKEFLKLKDGVYLGELLVKSETNTAADRHKSNGLLNSLNVPDDLIFYCWDCLTLEEFTTKSKANYIDRFYDLQETQSIRKIKSTIVNSLEEAMKITNKWISEGYEGSVLKNRDLVFENKTSKYQVKIKKIKDIDVKITGFTKGNGKYKDLFGAIEFESSDGLLKGNCSGMEDNVREFIFNNKEKLLNTIITVEGNEITKAKNSKTYAIQFPRFVCLRNDKLIADDINRILEIFNGQE